MKISSSKDISTKTTWERTYDSGTIKRISVCCDRDFGLHVDDNFYLNETCEVKISSHSSYSVSSKIKMHENRDFIAAVMNTLSYLFLSFEDDCSSDFSKEEEDKVEEFKADFYALNL